MTDNDLTRRALTRDCFQFRKQLLQNALHETKVSGREWVIANTYMSVTDYLPRRLEKALAAIGYGRMPYVVERNEFIAPGLLASGLPEPLALPLIPAQAEQLAALGSFRLNAAAGEICGTKCFQVECDQLTFENPDWDDAVAKVMGDV